MVQLTGIKNIIFDLGGVIINLNPDETINSFRSIFKEQFDLIEKELHSKSILNRFETGEISSKEFISFFQEYQPTLSKERIIKAWNSMLLDIPHKRILLIRNLARKYRVFLLSNTNQIHIKHINNYVNNEFGFTSMSHPFEKAYYSHEMKLRKPDSKIFEAILQDKKLLANETLFIDDSEQHIIAAKQLNLKTHYLLESETIVDIFNAN